MRLMFLPIARFCFLCFMVSSLQTQESSIQNMIFTVALALAVYNAGNALHKHSQGLKF